MSAEVATPSPRPAFEDLAGPELRALAVDRDIGAGHQRTGVGRKAAAEPAGEPGEKRLADERAFAAHHPAAHPGLAAEGDEALDVETA
jgi:hypothetical protein